MGTKNHEIEVKFEIDNPGVIRKILKDKKAKLLALPALICVADDKYTLESLVSLLERAIEK